MNKTQQGFTLIELMIVVAIIGILAAIAIPAYQDYTIRAKVSEGVNMAAAAKTSVSEYYISQSSFPGDNSTAGMSGTIDSNYVSSVIVSTGGVITVSLNSGNVGAGGNIAFVPTAGNGSVLWACNTGTTTVAPKYLPANCRP